MKLAIVIILIVFVLLFILVFRIMAKQGKEDAVNRQIYNEVVKQERIKAIQESGECQASQQESIEEEGDLIKILRFVLKAGYMIGILIATSFGIAYIRYYYDHPWWLKILVLAGASIGFYIITTLLSLLYYKLFGTTDGDKNDKIDKDDDINEIPG